MVVHYAAGRIFNTYLLVKLNSGYLESVYRLFRTYPLDAICAVSGDNDDDDDRRVTVHLARMWKFRKIGAIFRFPCRFLSIRFYECIVAVS